MLFPWLSDRRERIPLFLRRHVWDQHYQGIVGQCHCCGRALHREEKWCCTKEIPSRQGGTLAAGNLHPTCPKCHRGVGNQPLKKYIEKNNLRGPGWKASIA